MNEKTYKKIVIRKDMKYPMQIEVVVNQDSDTFDLYINGCQELSEQHLPNIGTNSCAWWK